MASTTMRSVFLAATLCWNIGAVTVGILMGLYAIRFPPCGWLSLLFGGITTLQGILAFVKLKQSLSRYVRFGLTSAAFSRTPAKLAVAWILTSVAGAAVYITTLIFFVSASSSSNPDEERAGRLGVVWYAILGVTMGSLLLGMLVVSRISPYVSSFFVQTPIVEEHDN